MYTNIFKISTLRNSENVRHGKIPQPYLSVRPPDPEKTPIYASKRVPVLGFPSQRYDKFLGMTHKEPEDRGKKTEFVHSSVLVEERRKIRESEKKKARDAFELRQRLLRGELSFKELRTRGNNDGKNDDESLLLGFLRDAVNSDNTKSLKRRNSVSGKGNKNMMGKRRSRDKPTGKLLTTKDLRERRRRQNQQRPNTTPYSTKRSKIRGLRFSEASPNANPHKHAKLDTSPPMAYTQSRRRPKTSDGSSLLSMVQSSSLK